MDSHVHFRQGDMLKKVIVYTVMIFSSATVMPNIEPPVLTAENAQNYRKEIQRACHDIECSDFTPIIAIQGTEQTTPEMVAEAWRLGFFVYKFYAKDVTNNSSNGILNYRKCYPCFREMEKRNMIACFHGEHPSDRVEGLDKEEAFLKILARIRKAFPNLRIILEHITTKAAVDFVRGCRKNVFATITPHHLLITHDDFAGYNKQSGFKLRPHLYCKPLAKRRKDRDALVKAAISGDPRFFLGSDTAPHQIGKKECDGGCAGIFNAPVVMECLIELFDDHKALNKLEPFYSVFGPRVYGLPISTEVLTYQEKSWAVPDDQDPKWFLGGQTLRYQRVS